MFRSPAMLRRRSLCHPVRSASFIAALLASAQPLAAAELLFLDGGYAELCARAAEQVYRGEAPQYYEVTGTRLGFPAMEICDRAVNGYDGSGENVAESYNNRGVLWFAQGDLEAALLDFERAVREQESMAQAHVNQGYTLNALQRWGDAVQAFTRGLALG